ncbi:hypothetical protein FOC1_g10008451 [Fusarium oxysporum f. sp. cubense race 1]|uniref:Uncharacterized protein n=1 Tax=Fusarium oxysporum f. sp. cubense (strain race 1) TaxID=1229664 RepID=N4U5E0_FUSC1|nr:hypothetical protein FOC1_g10008451 [Fusarium oxysporum f. sp. cubense race 1]
MFSRLFRRLRPARFRRAPPPRRIAPPADAQLGGKYPSPEQMNRYIYDTAMAWNAADAQIQWITRMLRKPF